MGAYTNRRQFLRGAAGFGASAATGFGLTAGILPLLNACSGGAGSAAPTIPLPTFPPGRESPPETSRIRLGFYSESLCLAPQQMAEDFLRQEGFTDISYVGTGEYDSSLDNLAQGNVDLSQTFGPRTIEAIDGGSPLVMLGGVHVACYQLFAGSRVNSLRDFKGKTVAVGLDPSEPQLRFLLMLFAYIGMNPNKDVTFQKMLGRLAMEDLRMDKIDGTMQLPPLAQEMKARNIGRVVLDSHHDKPWSDYFCCYATTNRGFLEKNPVATKRALRALYKATDLCARDPLGAARFMLGLYAKRGDSLDLQYAEDGISAINFGSWRSFPPEDTIRFFTLRLRETGLVKKVSAETIIKSHTDWRFLDQLRQELKA